MPSHKESTPELEELSGEPPKPVKVLTGIASLLLVAFSATGFLSMRASLNALGVPTCAEPSVDEYVQNGGRMFFELAVQFVPISVVMCLAIIICNWVGSKFTIIAIPFRKAPFQYFLVSILALWAFGMDTMLLTDTAAPVFSKPPHSLPGNTSFALWLTEAAMILMVAIMWRRLFSDRSDGLIKPRTKFLKGFAVLITSLILLLFPTVFGATAMISNDFDLVCVYAADPTGLTPVEGILVFTDSESYYVWTASKVMIQIPKNNVRRIHHNGKRSLAEIRLSEKKRSFW
jgi:hypothetical protein